MNEIWEFVDNPADQMRRFNLPARHVVCGETLRYTPGDESRAFCPECRVAIADPKLDDLIDEAEALDLFGDPSTENVERLREKIRFLRSLKAT